MSEHLRLVRHALLASVSHRAMNKLMGMYAQEAWLRQKMQEARERLEYMKMRKPP